MFIVRHMSGVRQGDNSLLFSRVISNLHGSGSGSGSGSSLYSGGLTWSIVLRCDDHTGIFTYDGCARDRYFYVPSRHRAM